MKALCINTPQWIRDIIWDHEDRQSLFNRLFENGHTIEDDGTIVASPKWLQIAEEDRISQLAPKYRLRISIIPLADGGSEVRITPSDLTKKIIDLYWGELFQHEVEAALAEI